MNFLNRSFKNLEHVLRAAYLAKDQIEVGNRWRLDVLRDIRHLGPLNAKTIPALFVNHFAWRFATVACLVALMLSVYVFYTGFNPTDEIANIFVSNPIEFTLTQVVGGE